MEGGKSPTSLRATSALWSPDQPGAWETQAFETLLEFHIPYMSFVEEVYVHADKANGLQRLSYYSGADVFLVNTTGKSFELVPVAEYESCLVTSTVDHLELTIPDLDMFRERGYHNKVTITDANGVESVGYEFVMDLQTPHVGDDGHWTYSTPVANFVGKYVLLVDASSGGRPVHLKFLGHNPFLVQSHTDEYTIIYKSFYPRPEGIDRSFFMPPQGMPCTPFNNPTGPFETGGTLHHKRPLRDLAMAMPGMRGDMHRQSVLRDMYEHFDKKCTGFTDCGHRQQVALRHFRWVQAQNRRGRNFKVGLNHMFDWTEGERKAVLGRVTSLDAKLDLCGQWEPDYSTLTRPAELDLRDHGLLGPPRDQGTCGSCWAFGTIGMIEGQLAKKDGHLTRMSEQHLLDCGWAFGNNACDGGEDFSGLSWVLAKNGGELPTADSYGTYLSENGFCHFDASKDLFGLDGVEQPPPGAKKMVEVGAVIRSCWHVPPPAVGGDEAAAIRVEYALANIGPLSISLAAGQPDFYYYSSGVYDDPNCGGLDADSLSHTVLATGYGTAPWGAKYWWIRNSWSTHWGEEGYARVAQKNNLCGLTFQANFALLA